MLEVESVVEMDPQALDCQPCPMLCTWSRFYLDRPLFTPLKAFVVAEGGHNASR